MRQHRSGVTRGAIAGVLAATAVVLFFLLVDVLRGSVLATPSFLASVLFGTEQGEAGTGMLAAFMVLHYTVFAVVGAAAGWFLELARIPATLLLGLVAGFLLFDLVFYASLVFTGVDVVRVLGWPTFLAGNLLAGVVLAWYLRRTSTVEAQSWSEVLREHRVVREGLTAGLLGAIAVAAWFFLYDLFAGRVLFTPAALGSGLFLGVSDPAAVQVTAATVLGYTVLHFAAFAAVGLVFAAIVGQGDRNPPVLLGLVLLFVTFETLVIGVIAIVASWLLDVLAWWSIGAGNLLAAAAMGVYLWKRHPGLARRLEQAEQPDAGASPIPGAGVRPLP